MRAGTILLAAASFASISCTALAAEPAALVVDYAGKPNAALAAFSELADGADFTLGANDSVTLLHYRTCKTLGIKGAKVRVTRTQLDITGGSQKEEPGQGCPKELAVATKGVGGGLVMRSVAFHALPATIDCVVVGKARARAAALEIVEDGKPFLTVAIAGARAVAPVGTPALPPDREFSLVVRATDGTPLIDVPVAIEDAVAGRTCLVRVD